MGGRSSDEEGIDVLTVRQVSKPRCLLTDDFWYCRSGDALSGIPGWMNVRSLASDDECEHALHRIVRHE